MEMRKSFCWSFCVEACSFSILRQGCGDLLYGDSEDDGEGAVLELAALLSYCTMTGSSSPRLQSPISNVPSVVPQGPLPHDIHIIPNTTTASSPKPPQQFLELCVITGQYVKVFGEISTANIDND